MTAHRALADLAFRSFRAEGIGPTARNAVAVLKARWQLRRAEHDGTVRLVGNVLVINHARMRIGSHVRLDGSTVRIELVSFGGASLEIGDHTFINYGTNISATQSVRIGANCAIGQYCIVMDNDYHDVEALWEPGKAADVEIGDRVWLGARVIVLPGSRIGEGSVIGANSVVRGVIPPGVIAAGMPARVIRAVDQRDNAPSGSRQTLESREPGAAS